MLTVSKNDKPKFFAFIYFGLDSFNPKISFNVNLFSHQPIEKDGSTP